MEDSKEKLEKILRFDAEIIKELAQVIQTQKEPTVQFQHFMTVFSSALNDNLDIKTVTALIAGVAPNEIDRSGRVMTGRENETMKKMSKVENFTSGFFTSTDFAKMNDEDMQELGKLVGASLKTGDKVVSRIYLLGSKDKPISLILKFLREKQVKSGARMFTAQQKEATNYGLKNGNFEFPRAYTSLMRELLSPKK